MTKFGYSAGFLIVVLGRQQLFTENTLTPILPLLQGKEGANPRNVLRLWTVVLLGNILGGLAMALAAAHTSAFEPAVQATFAEIGTKAMQHGFGTVLLRGIFAGWLIALNGVVAPLRRERARLGSSS